MASLHNDFFSSSLWDAPPFAVNLFHASKGIVFNASINLSSVVSSVKQDFFSVGSSHYHSPKVQKLLSAPIKKHFYIVKI